MPKYRVTIRAGGAIRSEIVSATSPEHAREQVLAKYRAGTRRYARMNDKSQEWAESRNRKLRVSSVTDED